MNVLVIAEDTRKDRYMLEPIIDAMMRAVGKEQARVRMCLRPILGGVSQALRWERIEEILTAYRGMVQVFLLCVDRDGEEGRHVALERIEERASESLGQARVLLAEHAWQEIEGWVLAGLDLPGDWDLRELRQEVHPKEAYFLPLAEQRGLLDEPGQGRKTLAQEAATRY
jgi:hypothetical protein